MSRLTDGTKYLNKMNCPYDQLEKTLIMLLQNKVDTFTIAIVPKSQTWYEGCNKKILVDYYIITWMSEEKV